MCGGEEVRLGVLGASIVHSLKRCQASVGDGGQIVHSKAIEALCGIAAMLHRVDACDQVRLTRAQAQKKSFNVKKNAGSDLGAALVRNHIEHQEQCSTHLRPSNVKL